MKCCVVEPLFIINKFGCSVDVLFKCFLILRLPERVLMSEDAVKGRSCLFIRKLSSHQFDGKVLQELRDARRRDRDRKLRIRNEKRSPRVKWLQRLRKSVRER